MSSEKKHYTMVVGTIVLQETPESESLNTLNLNAVVNSERLEFTQQSIGKAQQALQIQFRRQHPQMAQAKVVDVILLNLVYLGHMTAEDFSAVPEGMKIQEKK